MVNEADILTVYIVDDHSQVRNQLTRLVEEAENMMVVGCSDDADVAVAEITAMVPRVALLDGQVGPHDGLDVCRRVTRQAPTVACVIVTAGVGIGWGPVEAARAGAAAYLLKQLRDFPLVTMIERVASGERPLDRYLEPFAPIGYDGEETSSGGVNR